MSTIPGLSGIGQAITGTGQIATTNALTGTYTLTKDVNGYIHLAPKGTAIPNPVQATDVAAGTGFFAALIGGLEKLGATHAQLDAFEYNYAGPGLTLGLGGGSYTAAPNTPVGSSLGGIGSGISLGLLGPEGIASQIEGLDPLGGEGNPAASAGDIPAESDLPERGSPNPDEQEPTTAAEEDSSGGSSTVKKAAGAAAGKVAATALTAGLLGSTGTTSLVLRLLLGLGGLALLLLGLEALTGSADGGPVAQVKRVARHVPVPV